MQIKRVELKDNHVFGNSVIEFDTTKDDTRLNTISGVNGSGKSTIFYLATLVQKAYFCELYRSEYEDESSELIYERVTDEICENLKSTNAEVTLVLSLEPNDVCLIKNPYKVDMWDTMKDEEGRVEIKIQLKTHNRDWKISIDVRQDQLLRCFWNLKSPIRLIIYIPAEKLVEESDVKYEDVRLVAKRGLSQKLNILFDFSEIYNNMYSVILNDYIMQRINPKKGKYRNDYYVSQSKILFHELIPGISIGNISSITKENQFIITANKRRAKKHGYEVREFSSGEKLIWYTSVLLNYIKNIGVLIIDEPENHLHEDLLWRFTKVLYNICNDPSSDIALTEVFLLTHSKNLIYNNFSIGRNYVVDNCCVNQLKYEGCEDVLRNLGVSSLNEKVLFVEGSTDQSSFSEIFASYNIKVVALGNCQSIISAYTGIQNLAPYVQDKRFVFLLDRDTRDNEAVDYLRNKNPLYFDGHFVVLERREIENYYLDAEIFSRTIANICNSMGISPITTDEINGVFKKYADEMKSDTKKAYLNDMLHVQTHKFESMIQKRDINLDSEEAFDSYVHNVFSQETVNSILSDMLAVYPQMTDKFSDEEWESNWISLCDGKVVFERSVSELAHRISIGKDALKNKVISDCLNDPNSFISLLIDRILSLY